MLRFMQAGDREILSIIIELSKALRCCRQDEVFCTGEVTFTQFVILDAVAGKVTLDMADLHALLSVDKSTTTRFIAPLVKRKLLLRERSGRDSRAVMLSMTEAGKEVHRQASQNLKALIGDIRKEIPAGKKEACLEGSRMFMQVLQSCCAARPKTRKRIPCCETC